jgi:hypothetical protein
MIIFMNCVVSRLLLTLLALALKTENEKIYDCVGKKTDGSFHIDLFIILMLHQKRLIPLAQFIRHSMKYTQKCIHPDNIASRKTCFSFRLIDIPYEQKGGTMFSIGEENNTRVIDH